MKLKNKEEQLRDSIIYFLCNSPLVKQIVDLLNNINCYIFNEGFFKKNYTKIEMQKILLQNEIKIPKIYEKFEFDKMKFPIFCKENLHASIVFKAYTKNTLIKFFEKFPHNDFYIEESINSQKESKYYYIRGNIYSKNDKKIADRIKEECTKISKLLDLEVFSVDCIKYENQDIVIDVNSAAGFYLLDEARNSLIYELTKEINKK